MINKMVNFVGFAFGFSLRWVAQNGAAQLMALPGQLHSFFDDDLSKKARYPWPFYIALGSSLVAVAMVMNGILKAVLADATFWESTGTMGWGVAVAAIGGGISNKLTTWAMLRGNAWSWVPGCGYFGKDKLFHPMPWPSFILALPQLGPKSANAKLLSVSSNKKTAVVGDEKAQEKEINILPPAEQMHFAQGPANVDETVLRGTKVIDGYAYRMHLEAQARARGEDGLSGGLLTVGAVPVQYGTEQQHIMICGKPGSGKTQVINSFLRTIRSWRRNAAVIADPAGGYLARFGTTNDCILNPFDQRSEQWSPFADISEDYDCALIAKATIPDADASGGEWNHYAQSLLTEVLHALWKRGETRASQVLYFCATAPLNELADLLAGTPAAVLTQKGNDRMLGNVRGIISTYMGAWQYLSDGGNFSIRKFVRESDTNGGAFLFITYTDAQMAMLKFLIATWMELAVIEGLGLSESQKRRLWLVLDELDSLGKISSLKLGLTKLRKYGVCVIAGFQTVAQLRSTYGREDAQVLISAMSSKLILSPGDSQTADSMSQELGEQEIERVQTSAGQSSQMMDVMGKSSSTNSHLQRETKAAVMPAQLLSLPNLQGYFRMPGSDVLQVAVPYVAMTDKEMPYMAAKR